MEETWKIRQVEVSRSRNTKILPESSKCKGRSGCSSTVLFEDSHSEKTLWTNILILLTFVYYFFTIQQHFVGEHHPNEPLYYYTLKQM